MAGPSIAAMSSTELAPNHYARAERNALCDLFLEVGPDAPTLCEGWLAKDLAGHLVIREGRNPIASFGIFVPPLQGASEKARLKQAALPWPELVEKVRTGPPSGSMMRPAKLDGAINTVEYFVHHEDVRRGRPGWEPRALPSDFDEALWDKLPQFGKRLAGKAPVGLVLRTPDGRTLTVKEGTPSVTLVGAPGELVMHLFGRSESRVESEGDPADVATLAAALNGV